MNNEKLIRMRHSFAHLLGAAVKELYPDAKIATGPAIDNGFYYDFDFVTPITDKDLGKIEQKIRELIKKVKSFDKAEISNKDAEKLFKGNPYKLELIKEYTKEGQTLTTYTSGDFVDLCAGPHVESMDEIKNAAFKLERIAGAYWKGDEKNKMLTRVYGLAFESKDALLAYEKQQEEAKKRDHRKLGKDLDLFIFSEIIGKGLPLWTEKGATIKRELERFIVDEEIRRGYKHVCTPDLAKIDLYKKSGHYPYYKDSMYAPIKIDEEEFMLRPMTCPHHFELYLSKPRSYKELPMRIAELAKQYRYEQSGELSGLMRVRTFCLADAHIICADSDQAVAEINSALDLIDYIQKIFGLKLGIDYWYRLSLGDRKDEKKYYKDDKAWNEAEDKLRKLLQKRKTHFMEAENEAAFYGPKIDIQMKNVRGKDDTAFTVQYDFVMPKRFNLTYRDKDGKEKQGIVVHRSSIGAIERIVAFLIEHFAGAFPLWLAPVQIKIVPIRENHNEHAEKVAQELKDAGFRVDCDTNEGNMGGKVRDAKNNKVPYTIIIGDKDIEAKKISVESRDKGQLGQMDLKEFIKKIVKEKEEKK